MYAETGTDRDYAISHPPLAMDFGTPLHPVEEQNPARRQSQVSASESVARCVNARRIDLVPLDEGESTDRGGDMACSIEPAHVVLDPQSGGGCSGEREVGYVEKPSRTLER